MADYNINAITRRVVFSGSAGLGPYAFTFEILDEDDIAVYFNATKLTITTDYTVTVNANGTGSATIVTGGSVPSTPTASDSITIVGARDIERTTDFVTAGDLRAAALNEQLDGQIIMIQQLAEENKRSMQAPVTDPAHVDDGGTLNMTLPAKADRAGKYLAFNATTGNPEAGPDQTDVTTLAAITSDIATLADIEDGTDATDAIQTVAGISSNVTTVAGISANVTTVAGDTTNIGTIATDLTGSDTIGTVATNISNVNTVAGISSNVTTVAGISANVTTVAGNSANVTTVATNISDVNNFAAVYRIGATDPTTSLDEGDLFFNTTDNALKYYNGSSWSSITAGLTDIVNDVTPQLGGTLDANGNIIDMGVNTITDTKVGQWDTAYGWGDHSAAGYLTSETFTELSQDTTPQLGGDLDLNSSDITGTGNINITGSVTATSLDVSGVPNYVNQATLAGDTSATSTATTYTATGASITVPSATVANLSKIIIIATGSVRINKNTHAFADFKISRSAPSSVDYSVSQIGDVSGASEVYAQVALTAVDTSLSTGDHTYQVYFRKADGNSAYAGNIYYKHQGWQITVIGVA